jgi:hypothetical protein
VRLNDLALKAFSLRFIAAPHDSSSATASLANKAVQTFSNKAGIRQVCLSDCRFMLPPNLLPV